MAIRFVLLVAICFFISTTSAAHTGKGKGTARKDVFLDKVLQRYRNALLMCTNPHNFVCMIDPKNKKADLMCIPLEWRCDKRKDCPMGDDEMMCAEEECGPGQVRCCDTQECATPCDHTAECRWKEDELNCEAREITCVSPQMKCPEGTCATACDGYIECVGMEDENNCNVGTGCRVHEYLCPIQPGDVNVTCATPCDDIVECSENADESNCNTRVCPAGSIPCESIEPGSVAEICAEMCDDDIECDDGRDEQFRYCKRCIQCETTTPADECVFENECPTN